MINLNLDEKYRSGDEDGGQNNWRPLVDEKCVAKKTAGKSVERSLESADTMGCAGDVKSKYLFSTENDQSIWGECLSQVLPFIQHCWHFNAMLVNTDIYPSHQSFQWGEHSPGGQSSLRSHGCSIQITSVCLDLQIACYLSAERCNKNGVRKDRRTTW